MEMILWLREFESGQSLKHEERKKKSQKAQNIIQIQLIKSKSVRPHCFNLWVKRLETVQVYLEANNILSYYFFLHYLSRSSNVTGVKCGYGKNTAKEDFVRHGLSANGMSYVAHRGQWGPKPKDQWLYCICFCLSQQKQLLVTYDMTLLYSLVAHLM